MCVCVCESVSSERERKRERERERERESKRETARGRGERRGIVPDSHLAWPDKNIKSLIKVGNPGVPRQIFIGTSIRNDSLTRDSYA